MLVDVSKAREEVLSVIRETKKYKGGNFETLYIEVSAETRSLVEAAKVYILDNYEKVKDFLLEDEYVQIRGRYQENAEARKSEPVFV